MKPERAPRSEEPVSSDGMWDLFNDIEVDEPSTKRSPAKRVFKVAQESKKKVQPIPNTEKVTSDPMADTEPEPDAEQMAWGHKIKPQPPFVATVPGDYDPHQKYDTPPPKPLDDEEMQQFTFEQKHAEMEFPREKVKLMRVGKKGRGLLPKQLTDADREAALSKRAESGVQRKPIKIEVNASRTPRSRVEVRGNADEGYEFIPEDRGVPSSDLTASLYPSIIEDLERDEHIEHARHLIGAINASEDAESGLRQKKGNGTGGYARRVS